MQDQWSSGFICATGRINVFKIRFVGSMQEKYFHRLFVALVLPVIKQMKVCLFVLA